MFNHKAYLKLGSTEGTDFLSLAKGAYELANFEFSFEQDCDIKGKPSTEVQGGHIHLTIPNLPSNEIIEWMLNTRKSKDGVIVMLSNENIPTQKIVFKNGYCTDLTTNYSSVGKSFSETNLTICSEVITLNNGVDFDNFWTK